MAHCPTTAAFSAPTRKKLALITGGNKGIGREIARRIGTEGDFTAIIASRNVQLGQEAVEDLLAQTHYDDHGHECDCDVVALPIPFDLTDAASISNAAQWVNNEYDGTLDVLINNAAVCFNDPTLYGKVKHTPFEEQAGITITTNYFGTLRTIESFLPLLSKSSSPRIVNVASAAGRLSILKSQELVDEFTSTELTIPQLSGLMEQFVSDVERGTHSERGWPDTCYGVSKLGIIALTRVLARDHPEMMVNSVDPGYCKTDQNDHRGVVDPARGAYTPYLLSLMEVEDDDEEGSQESYSGLHFYEESEMPWSYQR
mmetsp:Transcript_46913/g.98442  ORF Transcript_46913/g.98442 Transcript_46913/m.98442 type:complete len:314 (-) Transcript_46913:317-1258(-)